MQTRRIPVVLAVIAVALLAAPPSISQDNGGGGTPSQATLPTDGSWQSFSWTGAPDVFATPDWDVTGPAVFDVTDCFIDGDQFRVWVDGAAVGTTSTPTDTGSSESDPDVCFASSAYSSGTFSVSSGMHTIRIEVIAIATGFSSGGAFIRAVTPAPSMPPLGMVVLVLAVLGSAYLVLRRRFA